MAAALHLFQEIGCTCAGSPDAFVSEVENMALAFILSLQILDEQFLGSPPEQAPAPDSVRFSEFGPEE